MLPHAFASHPSGRYMFHNFDLYLRQIYEKVVSIIIHKTINYELLPQFESSNEQNENIGNNLKNVIF